MWFIRVESESLQGQIVSTDEAITIVFIALKDYKNTCKIAIGAGS